MEEVISKMNAAVADLVESATGFERERLKREMVDFNKLFKRYLVQQASGAKLDWEKIKPPSPEILKVYDELEQVPEARVRELLDQLVVLKLNGGLGTTMGCTGPKSIIEVRNGLTFLDLIVKQIKYLNESYGVDVPLVLMNSFNTDEQTHKIVRKYSGQGVTVLTFNQKQFPRIVKDTHTPMPKTADPAKIRVDEWYPPGHGDIFDSLYQSPLYKQLVSQGKKYLFVSNVDNLGATVDLKILDHLEKNKIEYCMEVTKKTRADVKGGTLIGYEGKVKLLELAQVPKEKVEEFKSIKKFKIFNTNNLWVNLQAIETHLEDLENIEIIINQKSANGTTILQLETAAGAAIQLFNKAIGIQVERSRFLPVKSCADLLLIQSNLYSVAQDFTLKMNPLRAERVGDESIPAIRLSSEFAKVNDFQARFETIPDILELESLTVTGDVKFGAGVSLKGSVVVVTQPGGTLQIPSGSNLENKVVTGSLKIVDM